MNPKLFSATIATIMSLVIAPSAEAQRSRFFENPIINGLWVDGCILEFGTPNCSLWAKRKAANAFCRTKGYSRVQGTFYTRDEGSGHNTYRRTYFYRNGVKYEQWKYCKGCGFRISSIDCVS